LARAAHGDQEAQAARDRRKAPFVDRTAYVNWNAMMAGAFLQAVRRSIERSANEFALRVLERIWKEAWDVGSGGGCRIGPRGREPRGMLDDNVQAAAAFLDCVRATGASGWLSGTIEVMTYLRKAHADRVEATSTSPQRTAPHISRPVPSRFRCATPSPNGVAGLVPRVLAALTDQAEWRERLDRHSRCIRRQRA